MLFKDILKKRRAKREVAGFRVETLNGEKRKKIRKNYFLFNRTVLISPGNYIYPSEFKKWFKTFHEFKVKNSDVFVISFPKAGTTWTQEMVWCILNDLDFKGAEDLLMRRFPYLEYDGLLPRYLSVLKPKMDKDDPCNFGVMWKLLLNMPEPRTIKSHLHKELAPKEIWSQKAKVVYVTRDPRDVCVSLFYHSIRYFAFRESFDSFVDLFLTDNLLMFSPYWRHVLDYWKLRNSENVLFIRYEELKGNLTAILHQVATFLGKTLTEDDVSKLKDHLSFENMRNNYAVNNEAMISFPYKRHRHQRFMRKGKVGDYKEHLKSHQVQAFKEWTEKHLAGTDFPYYRDYD